MGGDITLMGGSEMCSTDEMEVGAGEIHQWLVEHFFVHPEHVRVAGGRWHVYMGGTGQYQGYTFDTSEWHPIFNEVIVRAIREITANNAQE